MEKEFKKFMHHDDGRVKPAGLVIDMWDDGKLIKLLNMLSNSTGKNVYVDKGGTLLPGCLRLSC
jgi:hypothetical protein